MKTKGCLGILGGIGAAAGVRLAEYAVQIAQERGAVSDHDFPEFILYNLPARGTDKEGFESLGMVKLQLSKAMTRFNEWGCEAVVIACNTAHLFWVELQEIAAATVVNMVEEASNRVKGTRKVGVLCSRTSRKFELYQTALWARSVLPILVEENEQPVLDAAIGAAIAGKCDTLHVMRLIEMVANLKERGAETVILGCTELPICIKGYDMPLPLIDAGRVAIEKALSLL